MDEEDGGEGLRLLVLTEGGTEGGATEEDEERWVARARGREMKTKEEEDDEEEREREDGNGYGAKTPSLPTG